MSAGKKALIFILIIAAIGGLIFYGVYNARQVEADSGIPRDAVPVQTEYPHKETITSTISAKGTVELIDRTAVFPSTQARIETVHVKESDEVTAGDLIVTYDAESLEALREELADARLALRSSELALESAKTPPGETELLQSETQIKQSEKVIQDIEAEAKSIDVTIAQLNSNMETARKKLEDTTALQALGVSAQAEADSARDALKSLEDQLETTLMQKETALSGLPMAEENVRLARAQYDALKNRLNDPTSLNQIAAQEVSVEQARQRIAKIQEDIDDFKEAEYAPVSGTVLTLDASAGDMASSGRMLMEIADTTEDNLVIRINVPEGDAGSLAEGQTAEIEGAAFGREVYSGRVSRIYPLAEQKQLGNSLETVLTVEIEPNTEMRLRAGYSIEATIVTHVAEDATVVSLMSTLTETDGTYFVYLMKDDYSVEKRPVTLGEYAGVYVQVDGVAETDRVILNPPAALREGAYVKPLNFGAAP
ncbi:MAG: efflux RND transporter periplasmic adaptor subunit [Clostridiales bacterium]|jgi:multidrug efflux pump subunit AcrA (membrane-fusion protein)|nr:efflux RND transporter periplasmic adaptor subunit [Clostridiales bacterium]